MLRFSLGVTRLDRIRNEYIRGTAHVGRLGDKVREARLRWFGHVQRRESLPLNAIRPLQMIQNAAARLVFNLPKFSHTTPLLRSLHWLLVAARIRFKTLMLAYKAKNGPAPSYLKALVTPRTAPRSLRSTSTTRLVPPSLREKDRYKISAAIMGQELDEQLKQYGFMPRKSTTDAIFALRILMEKYRDGQRELHCVFVDLEKAYDRVPREELWYCMRKSGVAEKYVRVVQDMYERSRTVVRCAVGQTEEFNVEVGLHQGSALSPFLFAIVMDQLSEEVRQESPWTMMFADDIVICSESREQVEENLERWRFALERRGMKVSRSKTEYMCVNEREGSGTVRLQGEEVKKVQEFKYLGSTVQSNGECGKEKISARIKGKVYRTVVRPAMLYGLETVSLKKRQESELEVAELKMLRFSLGVTRLDRIRNEYIRGTAHVGHLGNKVREARLRWFGHVQRRESCELEEKERFWSELDEVMESIPTDERVVIGADFNGHVGEGNRGDEEVMGKFGVKERNLEGQMVVDFAKRMDMAVVNTYFQKREEHRVTYKSGGRRT
ncbi:hypothetical protein QTP86_012650 [Hemibagrus guttatus]|nr:hypothetical protein QTP86_012650 [Hemibagrus guttatus]